MSRQVQVFPQPVHELDTSFFYDPDLLAIATEQNTSRLMLAGEIGRHLVPAYLAATQAEPGIAGATLVPYKSKDTPALAGIAGATLPAHRSPTGRPEIAINTDGWQEWNDIRRERRGMIKEIARKYGIEPEDMDARLLVRFVLLHECGHVKNYIVKGYDARIIDGERSRGMRTLPRPHWHPPALIEWTNQHPLRAKLYVRKHQGHLQALGIHSVKQLIAAQEKAYRNIPDEDFADRFALSVLRILPSDR